MPEFKTEEDAVEWMCVHVDDPYIDNVRFAFLDDLQAMGKYGEAQRHGCCGEFDDEVTVGGRLATVGCNYGH